MNTTNTIEEYIPPPPPAFVERIQYQECRQINDPVSGKRCYVTPDGERLPSITTILSATKDMTALNQWRDRIGHDKANEITRTAANRGTAMHGNLERYLAGLQRQPGNNPVHVQANLMANEIIKHGLSKVNEVWGIETSLYFPGLYSGTTDLVGVYDGQPAIMDYKQSNRLKKSEYVDDYRLQLCAYIMAHNQVYGTDIRRGVIFLCTQDCQYQQFDLLPTEFDYWCDQWLSRVEQFYGNLTPEFQKLLSVEI